MQRTCAGPTAHGHQREFKWLYVKSESAHDLVDELTHPQLNVYEYPTALTVKIVIELRVVFEKSREPVRSNLRRLGS